MQASRWILYARLMRLDKPTGIWLLYWPCAWGITLASDGRLRPDLLLIFLLGATFMRAAGCIINDMTDRHIDAQVERTRNRPLASGALHIAEAMTLLVFLLSLSLVIALMLGPKIVGLAALWLLPVAAYPWMKRLTWWPQLFLGLTFNAGALFGWLAVDGNLPLAAWLLYAGGVFWTLGYDTIYAHQDKEDDAKIGVKSTARRLGRATKPALALFYSIFLLLLTATGYYNGAAYPYFGLLLLVALHLFSQIFRVELNDRLSCMRQFKANTFTGLLISLTTLVA
jgi:4-hydroxybenzoate polyprenyltransferase